MFDLHTCLLIKHFSSIIKLKRSGQEKELDNLAILHNFCESSTFLLSMWVQVHSDFFVSSILTHACIVNSIWRLTWCFSSEKKIRFIYCLGKWQIISLSKSKAYLLLAAYYKREGFMCSGSLSYNVPHGWCGHNCFLFMLPKYLGKKAITGYWYCCQL